MESFEVTPTIAGSRRPIFILASSDSSSSSSHPPTPPSALSSTTSLAPSSRTRSRRKPAYVFKSPSADDPGEPWEAHTATRKRATPPYDRRRTSTSTDASRSSAHKYTPSVKTAAQRHAPLLPLYHPLGPLAQSLPKLNPGEFGLPSSLNIDDGDDQAEGEGGAHASSRSRRGGPKGREDDGQSNGTPNGTDKAAHDGPSRERNPSPRKRRGGGGGAKRKRKDAEDADGVFPPPAKRTRNPRGAAAAAAAAANSSAPAAPSPLVGPAVVASDLAEEAPDNNGASGEAAEEPPEEAQEEREAQTPKRGARARKPRAARPARRRDSSGSASTATSVSVSIAAATRASSLPKSGRPVDDDGAGEAEPQPRSEPEARGAQGHQPKLNGVDKHEDKAAENPAPKRPPAEKDVLSVEKVRASPASERPAVRSSPSRAVNKDVPMNGVTPPPVARVSSSVPASAPHPPPAPPPTQKESPQKAPPPQKEEREEGELSD